MVLAYLRPATLAEALSALEGPDTRAVAGGTDLMVELGRGTNPARTLVDLTGLERELRFLESPPGRLRF